jgi:hypothetical protein
MNKRGMFFTLGAVMIMALVLLFCKVAVDSRTSYTSISAASLRLTDLQVSVEKSLGRVIIEDSGISFDVDNDTITFNEALPNEHVAGFRQRLEAFKIFVEANEPAVSLDLAALQNDPVLSFADRINYSHGVYGSDILVRGTADSYDLLLVTDVPVTCDWDFTPGSTPVSIRAQGLNSSCDDTNLVDFTRPFDVSIAGEEMTVTLTDGLSIRSVPAVDVTIKLTLDDVRDARVSFPSKVINVTLPGGLSSATGVALR